MAPIVDGLTQDYAGKIDVIKLNAREEGLPAFEYFKLAGHPSYVIVSPGGAVAWSGVGVRTRDELAARIDAALQP